MSFMNIARRAVLASSRAVQRRGIITVEKPFYTANAVALGGGRNGTARLEPGKGEQPLEVTMASPPSHAGHNPEQMLALGYGGCFLGALRLVAKQKGVTLSEDVSVKTSVTLGQSAGIPGFALKVDILVSGLGDVADKDGLVAAAHDFCPYSRGFRQGIEATAKAE